VAHLVLYPDGYSNSPDVAVFVDFHFQGKILSRFFCVGTTLGKNHPFRNGIPAKNKAFTETGKEEELYVGSQSHLHDRYYADVLYRQKSICFCGKKRIGENSHFWVFL